MGMRVQPGVIGCTIRPAIAARDRSLEELIYDTAQLALTDAGITIDDVDGIVVASNDQFGFACRPGFYGHPVYRQRESALPATLFSSIDRRLRKCDLSGRYSRYQLSPGGQLLFHRTRN